MLWMFLIFFLPCSFLSWAGTVEKAFESFFFPLSTPADLSRKSIWFRQKFPVRNGLRSPLGFASEKNEGGFDGLLSRILA